MNQLTFTINQNTLFDILSSIVRPHNTIKTSITLITHEKSIKTTGYINIDNEYEELTITLNDKTYIILKNNLLQCRMFDSLHLKIFDIRLNPTSRIQFSIYPIYL